MCKLINILYIDMEFFKQKTRNNRNIRIRVKNYIAIYKPILA